MFQEKRRRPEDQGVTIIAPLPSDHQGFHNRLLMAGLRLSPSKVTIGVGALPEGPAILATGPDCTGYLFGTDGVEASESDLYRFLLEELREGQGVNIFGKYAPEPGKLVRSMAHFRHFEGRIMCSEERTLIGADTTVETLHRRSDLKQGNVVPFRMPRTDTDPHP